MKHYIDKTKKKYKNRGYYQLAILIVISADTLI